MKELLRELLIGGITALAIPIAFYMGFRFAGLKQMGSGIFKLGRRLSAPAEQGGRNLSGRIAHWGAGRGVAGRTVARLATGAVFVGGRKAMERAGESYRKGSTERLIARGMYRIQPSSKMNAELLEKVTPDKIAQWVNSDDPNTRRAVESLRRMVADSKGAIKLSDAQRAALFSGAGDVPDDTAPRIAGAPVPSRPQTYTGRVDSSGNPELDPNTGLQIMDQELPAIASAKEGGRFSRWGAWLASERPTIVPGLRQRGQSIGAWLGRHSDDWRGWRSRPISGGAPPAMPPASIPPPPGSPAGTPPTVPQPPPGTRPGYR